MRLDTATCFLYFLLAAGGLSAQEGLILRNAKEVNTPQLDFSPVPFRNGVLFTSAKSDRFLQCPPENAGDFTDIYFAPLNADGTFGPKQALQGELNGKYNDGVATVFPGSGKLIISRNNTDGKNAADVIDLKLYVLELSGEQWIGSDSLPFNSDDWSTAHPAVSRDGSLLVFSSNRPGSVSGSMDLWFSRLENGRWSEPVNAGPGINTAGSELFPSLDEYNNLFFSSNGHGGAGGLDLFAARQLAGGTWEMVGNLGPPLSQAGDDVSVFPMENRTRGYYSGYRAEGAGLDDVYSWSYDAPKDSVITLLVKDSLSSDSLPGSRIAVKVAGFASTLDKLYEVQFQDSLLVADEQGLARMRVRKGNLYYLLTSHPGYITDTRQVGFSGLTSRQPYPICLLKETAELTVVVKDSVSGVPLPFAALRFKNEVTGKSEVLMADSLGSLTRTVDCTSSYMLTASKSPWREKSVEWNAIGRPNCNNGKFKLEMLLSAPSDVVLEPIFFNFDKYNIRDSDAKSSLDSLTGILTRYPSLQVRLEAHCDARGPNRYNDLLAEKRAEAAKKYLISKGISSDRVSTAGYGEKVPVNDCSNRVICPESSHQLNRRVDVIPVRHDEPGVVFKARVATEMKVRSDRY